MRVSGLYHYNAMLAQMGTNSTQIGKLMEQLSTQKARKRAVGRSCYRQPSGAA